MNTFAFKLSANPMIGRRVLYMLNKADADSINQSRLDIRGLSTTFEYSAEMEDENPIRTAAWQEQFARDNVLRALRQGNGAQEGQILPAFIVSQWTGSANLQVFPDGTDSYWATSRNQYPGDDAPMFDPKVFYWQGGRWHFTVDGDMDGEEIDQTEYVKRTAPTVPGQPPRVPTATLSWEPDARGMWIYAD